ARSPIHTLPEKPVVFRNSICHQLFRGEDQAFSLTQPIDDAHGNKLVMKQIFMPKHRNGQTNFLGTWVLSGIVFLNQTPLTAALLSCSQPVRVNHFVDWGKAGSQLKITAYDAAASFTPVDGGRQQRRAMI